LVREEIINIAKNLGFDLVGFAAAEELVKETGELEEWLEKGYHGGMQYMERNSEKRRDVRNILPSARTVISLALNYYTPAEHSGDPDKGKISRYAWGEDYHDIIWEKLDIFLEKLSNLVPGSEGKSYVDTGPVMDKVWGVRSGIGWQGKNTNIINREKGSWFFIATVITDIEVEKYDLPEEDYCGSCSACIDACPTGALVDSYKIDGSRCISYLTIENKGEIGEEFRGKMDNWIFGCDICQDVCPWNKKFAEESKVEQFYPKRGTEVGLIEAVDMEQEEFSEMFRKSPVKRSKLKGLKRNALFLLKK
jgi:epoxyqueuosine reductase